MFRASFTLALIVTANLAGATRAAEGNPFKNDPAAYPPGPWLAPEGRPPHMQYNPIPIIVNGQLVYHYETNRINNHKIPKGPVRMWWDYVRSPQHQNEPDGALNPVGPGSFWTEFKFVYGSSRQFLGSAETAPVHRQFFDPELPPGYLLRAWQPKKFGHVE